MTTRLLTPETYGKVWERVIGDGWFEDDVFVAPESGQSLFSGGYPDRQVKVGDDWQWEWDTDFDQQASDDWDEIMVRVTKPVGTFPTQAAIDNLKSTMSAYRDSTPGTTTAEQMDATIRAIIDYIRYVELRIE